MHIFLTGEKGVGKTTLLRTIAASFSGALGGFYTVRLNTFLPNAYTVHLFHAGEAQVPTEDNFLFSCEDPAPDAAVRFEKLGCDVLKQSADLIIMDELGPHEIKAAAFQKAVWQALEADTPVLGVLQKADVPFLKEIMAHPKVYVLEVTGKNRDRLHQQIPELLSLLRDPGTV